LIKITDAEKATLISDINHYIPIKNTLAVWR